MSRAVDSTARAMAGEALSRLDNGGSGSGGTTVDAYSKLETDNLLNAKVDDVEFTPIKALAESNEINITYLANNKAEKTEVNALSELVADIDSEVDLKANKADVYTKTETNTAISDKVAEIVANAPEDFDTLKEMSDWIDSHEDSASAMNTAIKQNTSDIANLKAIDGTTSTEIASIKNNVAINRTTLGTECKNLLNPTIGTDTFYGITFVMQSDGSIKVSGTATETRTIDKYISGGWLSETVIYPYDNYRLSIKTSNNQGVNIMCLSYNGSSQGVFKVTTSDGSFNSKQITNFITSVYIQLPVVVGTAYDFVVYPMLSYANIIVDDFVPYKPSLQEQVTALTERIVALESALTTATTQEA